jgi:hypothetical protein
MQPDWLPVRSRLLPQGAHKCRSVPENGGSSDLEFHRSSTTPWGATLPLGKVLPFLFFKESIMSESKFYDLHVTGLGYLNRVRMVKPNKGETFLACSISALRGEWNKDGSIKPESTKFDVRVYGQDAIKAIEVLKPHGDEKRKVMIQFKLGDIYPEVFVYEKDVGTRKKGDTGVMIKGRLLKITNAWVDGNPVVLPAVSSQQQEAAAGSQ